MTEEAPTATIVFDGECVLCSGWVEFLIKRDPQRQFYFSAVQTPRGREILLHAGLDPDDPSSFVLLEGETVRTNTNAIIAVLRKLGGLWKTAAFSLLLLPRPFRDWCYTCVARNRYRLFGKREQCYLPAAHDRERFLQ